MESNCLQKDEICNLFIAFNDLILHSMHFIILIICKFQMNLLHHFILRNNEMIQNTSFVLNDLCLVSLSPYISYRVLCWRWRPFVAFRRGGIGGILLILLQTPQCDSNWSQYGWLHALKIFQSHYDTTLNLHTWRWLYNQFVNIDTYWKVLELVMYELVNVG